MIKRFVASTSVTACQRSFSQSSSVCGFFSIVPFSVTSTATASHTACAAGITIDSMISSIENCAM